MVAHAAQDLDHCREETNMIHGLGQLDATKVAWTVLTASATGSTGGTSTVHGSHLEVAETSNLWLALLICLRVLDSHHRVAPL